MVDDEALFVSVCCAAQHVLLCMGKGQWLVSVLYTAGSWRDPYGSGEGDVMLPVCCYDGVVIGRDERCERCSAVG
jgi:hypothetical protein